MPRQVRGHLPLLYHLAEQQRATGKGCRGQHQVLLSLRAALLQGLSSPVPFPLSVLSPSPLDALQAGLSQGDQGGAEPGKAEEPAPLEDGEHGGAHGSRHIWTVMPALPY